MNPNCQKCSKTGHEALFCPISPCLYCKSTLHKSVECDIVSRDLKINVICKECKQANHTINKCEKRTDSETYCEICQAANIHTANSCDLAAKLSREAELLHAMNAMAVAPALGGQFRGQGPTCFICGDPRHLARQCPRAGYNQPQRGYARGRGGMARGRGHFGGHPNGYFNPQMNRNSGYQNNYKPNFEVQNNPGQGFGGRIFIRGGPFRRGNFQPRGRGYPKGYQNFQNWAPQNFDGQNFNEQNYQQSYPQIMPSQNNGWNPNWNQIPWTAINPGQPVNMGQSASSNPIVSHTEEDNSGNENPPLQ